MRGSALRAQQQPEPVLLVEKRLVWGVPDPAGQALVQDIARLIPRCPAACQGNSGVCRIMRDGTRTRHNVLDLEFPIALFGVPRYKCTTHGTNFSLLTPLVFSNLPADTMVEPQVCT